MAYDEDKVSRRIIMNMAISHEEEMYRHKGEKPMLFAKTFKENVYARYKLYESIHKEEKLL